MPAGYVVSPDAEDDILEIWCRIAAASVDLADRIEGEIHTLFERLAQMPKMSHVRPESRHNSLRFFPIYSFVVVYQADVSPIYILGVLRGRRNLRRVLQDRETL